MEESEVTEFGQLFARFLERVVADAPAPREGAQPLAERLAQHLGGDPTAMPVVTERFMAFELGTVQVALDALVASAGTTSELVGVGGHGTEHSSLAEMLQMSYHGAFWVGAPAHTSVQVSADREMTCVSLGVYLVAEGEHRLAVLLRSGTERGSAVEVVAPSVGEARAWLARLREERVARNLLRGQVLSFEPNPFEPGAGPVRFHRRPRMTREDVVLPADVLDRVERQVAGIARYRDRLRAEGRHLKRGVLLYGPPGTGKTHTVRWLTSVLEEFTVVILAGTGIQHVDTACALARSLQPALIVLEDVDLVAEDREFNAMGKPLLFTVLDELDGLSADADVAFLLTTNRADLLEPALAQRPGRVDLATEVPLPDEDARRRLLALYGGGIACSDEELAEVLARTAGVPASFLKEVVRRATLIAAESGDDVTSGRHLLAAVEELVAAQEALTHYTLGGRPSGLGPFDREGVEEQDDDLDLEVRQPEPGLAPGWGGGSGWFAYAPLTARRGMPRRYGGYLP